MKITAENLSKTYIGSGDDVKALKPCSFTVENGERIAVTGESGSGKSTLLHLLGGLEEATGGSIKYDTLDLAKMTQNECDDFRLKNIGIVFQSFNLIPELTAYENIILPLMLQNQNIDKEYVNKIIQQLGLYDRTDHLTGEMSGGQQQKTALARALVNRPKILLCDEPTGNLDKQNTETVMNLIFETAKELNITLIVVTHNESITKRFDRIITISDGVIGGDV